MLFQLEDAGPAGSLFADALKVLKRRRSTLAALAVQLKTDLLGRQPLVCWFGMSNMTPISGSIRVHGIPCSESCGIQSGCRAKQRQEMPKRDLPSCDHRNIPSGKLNVWKINMFNPAWTTGGFIRPWARWASVVLARGGFSWDWPIPTLFWNGGFMSQQFKGISKDKIRYNLPYINTYLQYTYGAYGKNRSPFKSTSKQYHTAQWVMDHIARLRQGKLGHSLVIFWWR